MNLAEELAKADRVVQSLIDERHDRLQIRNRFAFEHARRANGQRLRNDGREKRRVAR